MKTLSKLSMCSRKAEDSGKIKKGAVPVCHGLIEEGDRQHMISRLEEPIRQVLAGVEEEKLHHQSGAPKDCNEGANGTSLEAFAPSHGPVVDHAQDAKGKDGQDNEYTVNPKEGAKEWDELLKLALPVEGLRHQGRGNQGKEMKYAADED